jgi:hypothetical protein
MALPTSGYQTYNQVGIREDLEDVIYDISPMDTYFFSNAARLKATNTRHDWQVNELDAPVATNAFVEGDDFSAQAVAATTKLSNYTQISRKDFIITRTANKVNTAGRAEELAFQTMKKGAALKRDIESAAIQNKAATAGASGSARVAASVETWIYTSNHIVPSTVTTSTTPAPVSGIAGTAGTDGTSVAFTETTLKSMLQQAWSCGGSTEVILLPPALKNTFDAFTGVATRFRNVGTSSQAEIVGASDVYVSSYGSHKAVVSRYMRTTVALALDMAAWGIAWLDPIKVVDIAKSGDSEKKMIVGEWTIVARTPKANAKVTAQT